jgi:hypothetical protein
MKRQTNNAEYAILLLLVVIYLDPNMIKHELLASDEFFG